VDQLCDAVKRCQLTTVKEKSKSYADATLSDIHSSAPSRTKVNVSGDLVVAIEKEMCFGYLGVSLTWVDKRDSYRGPERYRTQAFESLEGFRMNTHYGRACRRHPYIESR